MDTRQKRRPEDRLCRNGSPGASIGADLALAGLDATFFERWPGHVEAIRERGVTVNLPTRTISAKVLARHLCQVAEIREPFDVVFLIVKAYDTTWSCQLVEPVVAREGLAVGVRNGMPLDAMSSVDGMNDPERVADRIFDRVVETFMRGDTLTTVLRDWRKGRRPEIPDISGFVVETLRRKGSDAPIAEAALAIERRTLRASPENVAILVGAPQA